MGEKEVSLAELDALLDRLKNMSLAGSTKRSYCAYKKRYLGFCDRFGFAPVPISVRQAARYVAYLSQFLSPTSIPKYLTIIRVLHLEAGLPDPHVTLMYEVKSAMTGFGKLQGLEIHRVKPITPVLLLRMRAHLDLSQLGDVMFFTACLVGFYGLLRKSNLFPPSAKEFSPDRHLSRGSLLSRPWGFELRVTWTKTIQSRERILSIPLVAMPNHPLCPVAALHTCLAMTPGIGREDPVFFRTSKDPVLYHWFLKQFRKVLADVGEQPDLYGSHSLRRGGATWALECGLSTDVIKIWGDWKSQAYQAYLEVPLSSKLRHMHDFASHIPVSPMNRSSPARLGKGDPLGWSG